MTTDYKVPERVGLLLEAHASDPLNERVTEICRIAVAAELRQQADYYHEEAMRERKRSLRLADHAPTWQHEVAIASFQELAAVAKRLRTRADYLDPEGATR